MTLSYKQLEYEQLAEKIKNADHLYIYGAGIVAYGAAEAIQGLWHKRAAAFLVSSAEGSPRQLADIPVQTIDEFAGHAEQTGRGEDGKGIFILVATPEEYHQQIDEELGSRGYTDYGFLTSHLEYLLMGAYLKAQLGLKCLEDMPLTDNGGHGIEETVISTSVTGKKQPDAVVHMAISHRDRQLQRSYTEEDYVRKVQVGAALTKERIADAVFTDMYAGGVGSFSVTGDTDADISAQNPLYGELTATYFAWKHDLHDIMGLFHYRRILKVSKEQLCLLSEGVADVILPLPFVCYPDTSGQYGRYLQPEDVQVMWEVLSEKYPLLYDRAVSVLKDKYLYNYNILIATREVYEDYCTWLFSLLTEITARLEAVERERLPRYIGRIGEVLTSIYFLTNEKNWKIVHAEKVWRI